MRNPWWKQSKEDGEEPLPRVAVRIFLLACLLGALTISALHFVAWLLSHG